MIKMFNRINFYDKKYSDLVKEAEAEDGLVIGSFQVIRFEENKWYAIEDNNGEKRILKYLYPGMFTEKDGKWPGNVKIAKVFWESTEEELFAETFSPYPIDKV